MIIQLPVVKRPQPFSKFFLIYSAYGGEHGEELSVKVIEFAHYLSLREHRIAGAAIVGFTMM